MEKVGPTRRPPNYEASHKQRIDDSKEAAMEHDGRIEGAGVRIYTDGSGYKGNVGASAVIFEDGIRKKTVKYTLGPETEHTVFEGEAIGVLMGLHLASKSALARSGRAQVSINLDNQAIITSLKNQRQRPSQTVLDWIHDALEDLDEDIAEVLEFIWVPGHSGSAGNEAADEAAKSAAEGHTSDKKEIPKRIRKHNGIPVSIVAVKQKLTKDLDRNWTEEWIRSPRYHRFRRFATKERGMRYEKLVGRLRRNQMSILTQIRTDHIPLNFYLHRIKRSDTAECPHCPGIVEDIHHLLFVCNNYAQARQRLCYKMGRNAFSVRHLLNTSTGTKRLMEYLQQTRRFERTSGGLWRKEDKEEESEEEGEEIGREREA
jgi:ribonuclease HI